jgi:putative transposase
MVRGIEKRDIFIDDRDRTAFVDRLSYLLMKTGTDCLAWSLLSNHAHLLLRPTKGKLADMMRRLLTGYAVFFNLRHDRCGHLFQNRYKSIICEEDTYMLELVRYIHLNPFRAGLVSSLRQLDAHPWSGHAVMMGHRQLQGQTTDEVLMMFDQDRRQARNKYRAFVAEGIPLGKRDELTGGGLKRRLKLSGSSDFEAYDERILGSGHFVEHLWHQVEISPAVEPPSPPSIDDIMEGVAAAFGIEGLSLRQGSKQKFISAARAVTCFIAIRRFGYPGVEVSNNLGISRSGVILAAERGESLYSSTEALRSLFPEIDTSTRNSAIGKEGCSNSPADDK